MEAGVGLTLEVLAFHFRSPVNYRSFGFGGYAFSHIGGPEVSIPACRPQTLSRHLCLASPFAGTNLPSLRASPLRIHQQVRRLNLWIARRAQVRVINRLAC